jgi:ArsR family transcriptional regulator, lead/cadmium/zinc/bismuth-responsive transcriptional repressor
MGTATLGEECEVRLIDVARVEHVRAHLPAAETVQDAAGVFGLLSDPSRLRLLASLRAAGELCVCDVAAAAGMSESAASHALRLLRAHGVVAARRQGRMVHYSLRDGHVRMLLDVTLAHVSHAGA